MGIRWIQLVLVLILTGCATGAARTTLFYKAGDPQLKDLYGKSCKQSGLVINNSQMTTYYTNCPVIIRRQLTPRELQLWGK